MNKDFTTSLHTHVRSLFDADIQPNELAKRIKEMGGKGIAITDHGVLSSIEDYRRVFADNNLKLIPGVELYVDGGVRGREHLVLLAVNDEGYHCISKIVTESNENLEKGFYPVTTEDILRKYITGNGDVIALSACMQGIISAILLQNAGINKKIDKLKEKQSRFVGPSSLKYTTATAAVKTAEEEIKSLIAKRDATKRCAEQPFAKREKAVEKLEKALDTSAVEERRLLEADKLAAQAAAKELPAVKEELDRAKKALSRANESLKTIAKDIDKYLALEDEISVLKEELKEDDVLYEEAKESMIYYKNLFGADNFFAEVQYHGIKEEAICFPLVVKLARECSVPLVASNDVHILRNTAEEKLRRQILRSLRFGERFEEESVGDSELYLKNDSELAEALGEILAGDAVEEAMANISVIFNRCNVEFKIDKHYPKFSESDTDKIFDEEIKRGVAERFPEGLTEEYQKRLDYEVGIIKTMGYVDYHLVVKDFLEYGRLLGYVPEERLEDAPLTISELKDFIKENGWKNPCLTIGPGRGSAVGSLVCYCLGITSLDPIKYGLLFERFLNPERVSMPDIDSDIFSRGRDKVIDYVRNKYGVNAVCGIMTMTFQGPKGSINIAAKYYGLNKYGEAMTSLARTITAEIPEEVGIVFNSDINGKTLYETLVEKFGTKKDCLEILIWARIIEGSFTSYSEHAAGIVISDGGDIANYLPLKKNSADGILVTQCTKEQVEENGLLKFDFLGLKTLDIITQASRIIEQTTGEVIDFLNIDLNDEKVYKEIFAPGKTNSVFQFESTGMKSMLKRFKPECFEDLIILVSMFRPGPLQYLDGVIDVKNGRKKMEFLCPQLEPILGKTYGAIVYQEQVMQICQSLAGFTLGHADQVRRFMSKKKADKLAHEREAFVDGCGANGISETIANELFDQMMDFASYAFNKSHAAAYAFNAFITAWIKCYYPEAFFTAALNWTTPKKLAGLMNEALAFGVSVKAPDINMSGKVFEYTDTVRFGLSSVKGVKDHANTILAERENR